jgi:uncharacterized protein YndB with AHSA1/START domain
MHHPSLYSRDTSILVSYAMVGSEKTYYLCYQDGCKATWNLGVVQRDSDGDEYIFNGMYHEIMAPTRLVYTFEFEGMPGHVIVERVTFEEEEQDGKTKLTSESFFQTVEDRDIMLNLRVVDVRQKAWIV